MAEPQFTLDERQKLLRYGQLRNQDIAGRVGATAGNAGRIVQGKDPLYEYSPPGADNLTEQQKAELRAKYADILAKLAQAEREATSSDQDFQGVSAQSMASMYKATLEYGAATLSASGGVAQEKVQAYQKFGQAAIDQEVSARESQRLSPEGKAAVLAVAQQAQEGGVVNPAEVMATIESDMRALYEKNPAQIPAYVQNVERALQATGRPELAGFSLESALSEGLGGQSLDPVMADSLNRMMTEGYTAQATARALQEDGAKRREEATDALVRQNPYAPKEVKDLATTVASYLSATPGAERAYVEAPPADATPDEKRAYVEKASGGEFTVGENLRVVPKAQPDVDGVSYSAFVQANPMVDAQGPRAAGGPGPMQPAGGGYSRSGPTEDTIKSIRALRDQISTQLSNLDRVNLDPLSQARAEAQGVLEGSEAYARAPGWATRAAVRTAKREQFRDTYGTLGLGGMRAERDAEILRGQTAAPLSEVGLAAVRQVPRVLGRAALAGVGAAAQGIQNLRERRQGEGAAPAEAAPQAPQMDPQRAVAAAQSFRAAQEALLSGDNQAAFEHVAALQGQAQTAQEMRAAAKLFRTLGYEGRASAVEQEADDLEYDATSAARAQRPDDTIDTRLSVPRSPTLRQRQQAQETLETDPSVQPMEDFEPRVPGRSPTTTPARAYQPLQGRTLAEARVEDPERYGSVGNLIGDLGISGRLNEATANPDEVMFQRRPISTPPPRSPSGQVMTGESESTGGDERSGPAKLSDIGRALQDDPKEKPASAKTEPEFQTDMAFWRQFKRRAAALPTGDVATSPAPPPQQGQGVDFSAGGTIEPAYDTPALRALRRQQQAMGQ